MTEAEPLSTKYLARRPEADPRPDVVAYAKRHIDSIAYVAESGQHRDESAALDRLLLDVVGVGPGSDGRRAHLAASAVAVDEARRKEVTRV